MSYNPVVFANLLQELATEMVEHLLDSTTLARSAQRLLTLIAFLVLAACTSRESLWKELPDAFGRSVPVSVGVLFAGV